MRMLLALALLLVASLSLAANVVRELSDAFNAEERFVRAACPLVPELFFEDTDPPFTLQIPRKLARLRDEGVCMRLDKVYTKKHRVYLRLETATGADLELVALPGARDTRRSLLDLEGPPKTERPDLDRRAEIARLVLEELFDFGPAELPDPYCGNLLSRRLHLSRCNHLPAVGNRLYFADHRMAEEQGYRNCNVCMERDERVLQDSYIRARRRAVEQARRFEIVHPPWGNTPAQDQVQRLGSELVRAFPADLPDYDYRFRIVESEYSNALSFPTGFVYLSRALYEAIEDSCELEFILAHELMHNAFHQLYYEEPGPVQVTPIAYTDFLSSQRSYEKEADVLALYLCAMRHGGERARQAARQVLKKLHVLNWDRNLDQKDYKFLTHPALEQRVAYMDSLLLLNESQRYFEGRDEDGHLLARLTPIGLLINESSTQLCCLCSFSDLIEEDRLQRLVSGSRNGSSFSGSAFGVQTGNTDIRLVLADGKELKFNLPGALYAHRQRMIELIFAKEQLIRPGVWLPLIFSNTSHARDLSSLEQVQSAELDIPGVQLTWTTRP